MPQPSSVHPERLAEKPQVFEGVLVPGDLARLRQSLASGEGELRFKVTARLDRQRRKVVTCIIQGFVFLTCHATLEPFRHAISIDDRLVLVGRESELPPIEAESDVEDYLVADAPLEIRDLVEDSVLLALPMVPRKPGLEARSATSAKEAQAKPSAFASLASLKRAK